MIEVPGVVTLQESRGSARTPGGDILAFLNHLAQEAAFEKEDLNGYLKELIDG